ncbi:hypothetical protein CEP53_008191 [Fusarium sp. AF-6]|nr:hypothetical protein CEP53_008191 [Fusarium sp. AF-6]
MQALSSIIHDHRSKYEEYNTLKYGNISDFYFSLYPSNGNATEAGLAWNEAARDLPHVGTWAYATNWLKSASSSIYTYVWDHAPPGQSQGTFHQSEIVYVLNALYANAVRYSFTEEDYHIAEVITGYWINFLRTGNPNEGDAYTAANMSHWYPNDEMSKHVQRLGNEWGNVTVAEADKLEFFMDYFHQQTPY